MGSEEVSISISPRSKWCTIQGIQEMSDGTPEAVEAIPEDEDERNYSIQLETRRRLLCVNGEGKLLCDQPVENHISLLCVEVKIVFSVLARRMTIYMMENGSIQFNKVLFVC